jgi:phosphohistidine phosphatase SixA
MGRWLRSTGYRIDLVMCSELKRSHQTAKRMANRIDAPLVIVPELGPGGDPESAWKAILKTAYGKDPHFRGDDAKNDHIPTPK